MQMAGSRENDNLSAAGNTSTDSNMLVPYLDLIP